MVSLVVASEQLVVPQPIYDNALAVVWCDAVLGGKKCDVRCGAVRCGAVRCGAVRCGVVWCGVVRCGVVWCGAVRCGAVPLSVEQLFMKDKPLSYSVSAG